MPVIVGLTCLAFLYFTGRSLAAYYFDPKYARDDYRGLVRHLEASSAPRDAIILNAPGQTEVFGYYYRGSAAVYPLPRQRPADDRQTIAELERIGRAHPRVWLVLWADDESDPKGVVESWLRNVGRTAEERGFGTVRLQLYDVAGRP